MVVILNCCCFFQLTVFGDNGQIGHLVQNLAGAEPLLNHVPRVRLNKMVEIVQDPEVTDNVAIHNLVHLQPRQPLLHFKQKVCIKNFQNTNLNLFLTSVTFKMLIYLLYGSI